MRKFEKSAPRELCLDDFCAILALFTKKLVRLSENFWAKIQNSVFLMKFDIKNGFYESFPLVTICILDLI